MSFWSQRNGREKMLIVSFGLVAFAAGGMKLLASEPEPVITDDLVTGYADAAGTPGQTTTPPAITEPVVHPKGPGSKRDPFDPLIVVGGSTTGSAAGSGGAETSGEADKTKAKTVTVRLHDIYPNAEHELVASLEIDNSRFKGRVGQTVAKLVEVVELGNQCGVFEVDGERVGLCVGQAIEASR